MRRKLLPFFTLGAVILVVVTVLHTFGVTGTGKRLEFQTVAEGSYSGLTVSAYYVINDVDELARVWNPFVQVHDPEKPMPEIDFSETTIIVVFMGLCPTTGYGIDVKEIIDTGLSMVVRVEKTYPKGCVVGEMLTFPFHIVKVEKTSKYIIFDTISRAAECG